MSKLKLLDLFSGIGGFSLGLERTGGFETVAFCEIDPFCQKVLAKHWKGVPIHDDITTLEYSGPVDVVTAGFPCQDISLAGEGAGLAGERSGLFWHILRTARLVGQPKLMLENVAALLNRGMGAVLGALAQVGYDAEWDCIPAAAVGAPHLRDRLYIFADADEGGKQRVFPKEIRRQPAFSWCEDVRGIEDLRKRSDLPEPLFRGASDGVPDWMDRVGAPGNAVVPQIPELLGNAYLESIGWRSAA